MQIIKTEEVVQATGKEPWFRKWFTKDNLIILVLAGVLLFVITLPTEEENDASGAGTLLSARTENDKGESPVASESGTTAEETALEEYTAKQEAKLKTLLRSMEGVGDVEVMLTFASSEELVVEKDAPVVRSNTVEKDSAGGTRTITQYDAGDTTVYNNVSGDSTPYVVKTLSPRVEGVLVVAQGGGNSEISRNITEAVQALFGVEANRVKVLDMDSGSSTGKISSDSSTGRTVKGLSGN